VLTTALETTERVIEDRRRQVLRELAARTSEARSEEDVWRVSAEVFGNHRHCAPFAFLYEYRAAEHQAHLAGVSVETDEALHPPVIDCHSENLWRFDPALTKDGVVIELGDRASGVPVPNWPDPPKQASMAPIRLGGRSEALVSLSRESIPAEPLMLRTANSSRGSPNRSLSGWPALAHMSRNASGQTR